MLIHTAAKHIKEHHVWFSIFFKSHRSRYTRLQRTSTAFALLFLSMLVDAMWYGIVPEQADQDGVELSFIKFTLEQAYVGCMVALVTLVPTIMIMIFFKNSKQFKLRLNRIDEVLKVKEESIEISQISPVQEVDEGEQKEDKTSLESESSDSEDSDNSDSESSDSDSKSSKSSNESDDSKESEDNSGDENGSNEDSDSSSSSDDEASKMELKADVIEETAPSTMVEIEKVVKKKKKSYRHFTLPFIFRYIAWILCLGSIGTSCFFLIGYGITFGNDKTHQWLTSMIVSFFFGLLIIEPIKVALMSCCISATCKNTALDSDDDVEDDEFDPELANEEEWIGEKLKGNAPQEPIDEVKLDIIRIKRQKDLEIWAIVKELTSFFFFILIAFLINYLNRNPNFYRLQDQLRYNFVTKNGFDQVRTTNDWWKWMHVTAVTELKAASWYNGQPPYGLRGFIGDMQSRVMGYGTLRQIRVKPNSCRVHHAVRNLTQECAQASIIVNEDDTDYCNAWEEKTQITEYLPSCIRPEFKYTTAKELNSGSYTAGIDSYGGGGYVYRVRGSSKSIREDLKTLHQQRWINNHTRAVFLEFSVYNANTNLFGIATIVAEFIPGGGILPYWRFDPVRLLHGHEKNGPFVMFCQILFICYILFFTYQFIRDVKTQGCSYFHTYWSIADVSIILTSFLCFFVYGYRYILTREILDTFVETKGNGYMKLQYVGLLDEYYGIMMALILFIAMVKMIKLLRFNNRFKLLIMTLRYCWDDLSGFLVIFFLVFFSFVQLFYTILQSDMEEFHSMKAALQTCFTMMLNKFKFGNMKETSMTAAVMFFFFAVSCTWVLINVLLTIIIESYMIVKLELEAQGNQYDILDFLKTHGRYAL